MECHYHRPLAPLSRQSDCSEQALVIYPKEDLSFVNMQRFKIGDPVLVLPRFAHLFSINTGLVTGVNADRFRPMFNEYSVKLDDGTNASVFEFQLIEDELKYQTFIAALIFDSDQHSVSTQMRGPTGDRHVVFQTPSMDIDLKIKRDQYHASIIGQILERSSPRLAALAEISLLKDNDPLTTAVTDNTGTFSFPSVPRGPLNIQVLIRANLWRILGMFSV
jgi:hypothetical protein